MAVKLYLIIFAALVLSCYTAYTFAQAIDMDVKCTVYEHSDDMNGNDVDVRILVMKLKENSEYTAQVIPDHNPSVSVKTRSDSEGIFWAVAKIPSGEKSTMFSVNVYEGNDTNGRVISSGSDDAPCYNIVSLATDQNQK